MKIVEFWCKIIENKAKWRRIMQILNFLFQASTPFDIFSSQTFLVQKIDGTGLPDALHSRVTAPPFLAVIWPLDGTARTLGGTVN